MEKKIVSKITQKPPPLEPPREEIIDGILYKLQSTDIIPSSEIDPLEIEV